MNTMARGLPGIRIPLARIQRFCGQHHIRKLALFGSILTDRFRPDSDVDVLVEFGGYGEENQTGDQVMRFLIMLEQTETGFAVQAPDLAIATFGENIEAAKRAAGEAIRIN